MIETLLGGLLGGAFRLAPEILKWLDRKGERGHELAMQDKALDFEKLRGAQRMDEIGTGAEAAWNAGAIETLCDAVRTQGEKTGVRWSMHCLSSNVRPVITYWFMALVLRGQDCCARCGAERWRRLGHCSPARMDRSGSSIVGRSVELLVPRARFRPGAAVMNVPHAAIELAKRFEGFHLVPKIDPGRAHPYICPAGYWTIGYGHLCNSKHPPITEPEAEVYLARDLMTALNATLCYCPVLATEPEGRLQTSTLRRRVNQRDWTTAATELRRWIYGGGKVLPGLVARR